MEVTNYLLSVFFSTERILSKLPIGSGQLIFATENTTFFYSPISVAFWKGNGTPAISEKSGFERVECHWLCNFMQIYLCKPENQPSIHSRYLSIVLVSSTSTDSILQFKYWYGQYLDMRLFWCWRCTGQAACGWPKNKNKVRFWTSRVTRRREKSGGNLYVMSFTVMASCTHLSQGHLTLRLNGERMGGEILFHLAR